MSILVGVLRGRNLAQATLPDKFAGKMGQSTSCKATKDFAYETRTWPGPVLKPTAQTHGPGISARPSRGANACDRHRAPKRTTPK